MGTETVTVMFTDLVGSTALLSRVGPDAGEELRREHFSLLRAAVSARGREVKNLGDGLMLVFASAADAVAAAVSLQQALEVRNRAAEHELSVRVGVAIGDADVEDGDYFGVPVVEAARLCAAAEGGEVLATEVVRLLAGTRGAFGFESVGELELKGLDEPVAACRITWEPLADPRALTMTERPPLPARLAASLSGVFVGRAAEHDLLQAAWKAAGAGERRIVLLSGEPGMGKTTLAARFAAQVHGDGGVVLYGRSDEDLGVPFQPWIEALGPLVTALVDAVLVAHTAERGGVLARLVPDLRSRVALPAGQHVDADAERYALFASVVDLLRRAAESGPVLLVVDDLHWADRATVQLLRHLATADLGGIAVVATFRDSDVGADHPVAELCAALHREQGVDRVSLRGLGDADLLALLEGVAGHEMTEDGIALRDALLEETEGNPFFVGEIVRHLAETRLIVQDDAGHWSASADLRAAGLPVSVKEVVGRRVAGLGAETQRLLTTAAVIGRDFTISLLAEVSGFDEDATIDLCDRAAKAAVLRTTDDPERYTFAHALIEHTLYDGLSPARRARTHRIVAEALEQQLGADPGEQIGELAHHWSAAVAPTDIAKALGYTLAAADRALEQLAPEEALRWAGEALSLLDRAGADDGVRARVLLTLGDAQRRCGIAEHRDTLLQAARLADRAGDTELVARAVLTNSRGWQSVVGGVDQDRLDLIDLALRADQDPASATRAQLLAAAASERVYGSPLAERLALAEEAVATARRSGDPTTLATVLHRVTRATEVAATIDRRAAWIAEAEDIAATIHDEHTRCSIRSEHLHLALQRGDGPESRRALSSFLALVDGFPLPELRWLAAIRQVIPAVLDGRLAGAEALAESALNIGFEAGQHDAMSIYGAQLTNIRRYQDRLIELVPLLEEAATGPTGMPVYRSVLADAHAMVGDRDTAVQLLRDAAAIDFETPEDESETVTYVNWVDAAVRSGYDDVLPTLRRRLAPYADTVPCTVAVHPAVAHYVACIDAALGDVDDAEAGFEHALAINRRLGSPTLVAMTQAWWAWARAKHGDPAGARALATEAHEAARALDIGLAARDAHAVLAQLG